MTQTHRVFQVCARWVLDAGQTTDLPLTAAPQFWLHARVTWTAEQKEGAHPLQALGSRLHR